MEPKTKLQECLDHFDDSGLSYGDHINHSDIDAWCNFEVPDVSDMAKSEQKAAFDEYALSRLSVVEGLKNYCLTERRMYLQTVIGSGYRVVHPAEQTEMAVKKGMKEIAKGLKHAAKGTEMVNTAMLSASEREYNQSVRARLAGLATLVGKKKDYLAIK